MTGSNQKPHEPSAAVLVVSLGGSPAPIRTCLVALKPMHTLFIVSPGTKASIASKAAPSDAPATDAPTLAQLAGSHDICQIDPDDPDGIFTSVKAGLEKMRREYPRARLVVDYTGGTKSMSAAMVYAAMTMPDVELQFMQGERQDTKQIVGGTEKPQRMATNLIVASRLIGEARAAMLGFDYQPAADILNRLKTDAEQKQFGTPEFRSDVQRKWCFAQGMHLWDSFDHSKAMKSLEEILPENSALRIRLAGLCAAQKEPGILFDLWLNALRRAERGRFDDAMGRAYRLVEWTAQWRFKVELQRETKAFPSEEIPNDYRKKWNICAPTAEIGSSRAWRLLRRNNPQGKYGSAIVPNIESMDNIMKRRNMSILAHGFEPVSKNLWEEAKSWIETNIVRLIMRNEDIALPEQLPKDFIG